MAVTVLHDEGHSNSLSPKCNISIWIEGAEMQNDERDALAILEFDLCEETIGFWLRCIMQRLEERRDLRKNLPQLSIEAMNRFQATLRQAGLSR